MKTRGVKRGGRLEKWFSGEDDKIEKCLHETNEGEEQVDVAIVGDDTGVVDAYDDGVVGAYDAGPSLQI
ncbi:hypothetical protein VNO80_19135 [Phaseolus coccineus]|uniref:Uncharacterized protein n=1 Tax=Phaseolus coccineus TaxID=3886 RepID=A0AAN9MFJ2_PHACN